MNEMSQFGSPMIAADSAQQEDIDAWIENERDLNISQEMLDAGHMIYRHQKVMLVDGSELTMRRILVTNSGMEHLQRLYSNEE